MKKKDPLDYYFIDYYYYYKKKKNNNNKIKSSFLKEGWAIVANLNLCSNDHFCIPLCTCLRATASVGLKISDYFGFKTYFFYFTQSLHKNTNIKSSILHFLLI